jgi:hypothetical protein
LTIILQFIEASCTLTLDLPSHPCTLLPVLSIQAHTSHTKLYKPHFSKMKTTLSVLSAALLLNMAQGANAFSVRMVPVARTLTPRFVSAMVTPESRLDR